MKNNFFYQVSEFASTFGRDHYEHEPFTHTREFKEEDPLLARAKAFDWYQERMRWYYAAGGYFLPWGGIFDAFAGTGAAHSITLYLVTPGGGGDNYYDPILGEDDETMEGGREIEEGLFNNLMGDDFELSYEVESSNEFC